MTKVICSYCDGSGVCENCVGQPLEQVEIDEYCEYCNGSSLCAECEGTGEYELLEGEDDEL